MPSLKCVVCGHRILLPAILSICPNCGSPLPVQTPQQGEDEASHIALMEPERRCPLCEESIPCTPDLRTCPHCGTSLIPQSRSLIASASRSVAPDSRPQPPAGNVPPDIYLHVPPLMALGRPELSVHATQSRRRTRYPFWFPRRPPDLEGIIVQVQSQMEHMHPDIGVGALHRLRDMIWALPAQEAQPQKEQVFVTMLRVRTADGSHRDARLQGYQTGVNPSLGDTVSLWGWQRRGVLRVRRGYNHTTQGIISTSATTSPLPALALLIALLIALYLLSRWYHIPLLPRWP